VKDSKLVRAIKENSDRSRVKRVLDDEGVSASPIRLGYLNFFRELNSKKTHELSKDERQARVNEITAKYVSQGLKPEVLGRIVRLVFP
jgi:hypothetical protein